MVETVRKGKRFELGAPYLASQGICYFWPGSDSKAFAEVFNGKRERLGNYLNERAWVLIDEFDVRTFSSYPYLQSGMEYEIVHIGDDGRWIEFGKFIGNGMCAFHNIDSYKDRVMGFNLCSDALEFLDEGILAPRIQDLSDTYRLTYPLPEGFDVLPLRLSEHREWLERVVGCGNSRNSLVDIKENKREQSIELSKGRVSIKEGWCVGEGFERFGVIGGSFLVAKLVDACTFS